MFPPRKIICPTDFSEPSLAALELAKQMALHCGSHLYLLHVVPGLGQYPSLVLNQQRLTEAMEADAAQRVYALLREHLGGEIKAEPRVRTGNVPDEIIKAAQEEQADLIVIATHGLTGWRHLAFGSVTEKVLRLAQCPVLTTRVPASP